VQAAHVVLARRPSAAMRGLWAWIEQHRGGCTATCWQFALANKLARILHLIPHGRAIHLAPSSVLPIQKVSGAIGTTSMAVDMPLTWPHLELARVDRLMASRLRAADVVGTRRNPPARSHCDTDRLLTDRNIARANLSTACR
jgi:hypothetical protein